MPRNAESDKILAWSKSIPLYVEETLPSFKFTQQQLNAALAFQELVWAKLTVNGNPTGHHSDKLRELSRKFGMSIMSGVGTGKGALASVIILWFLTCFPYPKCVAVSPSARQLRDNLWAELAKWHQKSKVKDFFVWQSDKFYLKECDGQQWFISARTANPRNSADEQAETLAGIHEDFVLIVGDEATGVPDPVFRPLEATLTRKCNLCLLTFNPTKGKGFAYDTQFKERSQWITRRWNSEESELVTRESIERLERKYGRESNAFRIRVLGLPPLSGDNEVIPWDYIEDAVDKELEPFPNDKLIFSLDVGAGGDDSVLLKRLGPKVLSPLDARGYNEPTKVVDWVVRDVLAHEPAVLYGDMIGWGWGVVGEIDRRVKHICRVVPVKVSEKAFNEERFYRLRDELWWRMREAFERGVISIPDDPILKGDLNAPKYDDSTGVVKIETKDQLKKRGVESPNRADSLMMTYLEDEAMVRRIFQRDNDSKPRRRGGWKTA